LTYDGAERWSPLRDADAEMLAAFHAHQRGDKGLGVAAGPGATAILRDAFERRGWLVATGPSPWRLGARDAALIAALAEGSAHAVAQTGRVAPAVVADWLAARRGAAECVVGHVDLFAAPR